MPDDFTGVEGGIVEALVAKLAPGCEEHSNCAGRPVAEVHNLILLAFVSARDVARWETLFEQPVTRVVESREYLWLESLFSNNCYGS